MARVSLDDEVVYEGNYWDFYPGCYGGWEYLEREQGTWRGVGGFCAALRQALEARGHVVTTSEGTYTYVG